ncbi:MAG: hypothetical protein HQK99_15775 [Nitrospirae bacterium]|nr:hypothetical protein [Nitrospirota bacterium]
MKDLTNSTVSSVLTEDTMASNTTVLSNGAMVSILESANFGNTVLYELAKLAELPKYGFIAGGSVANAIFKLLGKGNPPINDIDIFTYVGSHYTLPPIKPSSITHRVPIETELKPRVAWYNQIWGLIVEPDSRYSYTVVDSTNSGILNYVTVRLSFDNGHEKNLMLIIKGFDINACQVGVDIEIGKLYYTEAFITFIKTWQLQVSHAATPFHTAVRLCKKKDEIGCYLDIDSEMTLLAQVPLVLGYGQRGVPACGLSESKLREIYSNKYALTFGMKYYQLYQKYKDELEAYFVCKSTDTPELYTMIPRSCTVIEYLKDSETVIELLRIYRLLQGKTASVNRNKTILSSSSIASQFLICSSAYSKCDLTAEHIRQIDNFIEQHPIIATVLFELRLNVKDQLSSIRVIKRFAKREGVEIIGLLEHDTPPVGVPITEEYLCSLRDKYMVDGELVLKRPELVIGFNVSVKKTASLQEKS